MELGILWTFLGGQLDGNDCHSGLDCLSLAREHELTANNNTPYTWFWLDLRGGPLVVEAPPNVLGLANDMWYRWVGDIGLVGPDKGKGGKYLVLPPGYKGRVP